MDNFIISYIAHRMGELGFKKYSLEPILMIFNSGQTEYLIDGQNEYYYLASKVVADQVEIFADNNHFKPDNSSFFTADYSMIQEFTGQLRIVCPIITSLEFIRVIPQLSHQ